MKIDILVKFCTLFSFQLQFKRVVSGLGGQNPLRAQSKYGLMGSSVKTGKKNFCRSQEQFLYKTVIWDRTPPAIHQMQCICVGEGSRVPNLQTELNYLYSFKSYCIFSDLLSLGPRIIPASSLHRPPKQYKWRQHGPRQPCCPCIVPVVPVVPASSPLSP